MTFKLSITFGQPCTGGKFCFPQNSCCPWQFNWRLVNQVIHINTYTCPTKTTNHQLHIDCFSLSINASKPRTWVDKPGKVLFILSIQINGLVLTHWSYVFLALTDRNVVGNKESKKTCNKYGAQLCVGCIHLHSSDHSTQLAWVAAWLTSPRSRPPAGQVKGKQRSHHSLWVFFRKPQPASHNTQSTAFYKNAATTALHVAR